MWKTQFPGIFTDQLFNKISLAEVPQRIISLVPSQTELLFDLGLGNRIIGVTKFCIHPKEKVAGITKIGGTKNFDLNIIRKLSPDLIIGNKEENYIAGIQALQSQFPVWVSDITTLKDALNMIASIGIITDTTAAANNLVYAINQEFNSLGKYSNLTAAYFIWRKPYMVTGSETFIHEIMEAAGFENVFAGIKRYPEVTAADLIKANPNLILLSSEPYLFQEKHIREMQDICPDAIIKIVDGELFSWYGSRLKYTPAYLRSLRQAIDLT